MDLEINDLQKWNIAKEICTNYDANELIAKLSNIPRPEQVKFNSKKIDFQANDIYTSIPYRLVLIDLEGSPVILIGLMIHDSILTYYIEDYQYLNEFYIVILEIMFIARDVTFFCFSSYEQQELLRIYTFLSEQGFNLSKYEFIKNLSLINLQKDKFDSITEAVFSTNPNVSFTGDPLFRNIKIIDKLFMTKHLDEIITHNRTCLLNESIILQRWVKHYNISVINKMR